MPEPEKKDYTFEAEKKSPIDDKLEAQGIPVYMERLELSDEQKQRLSEEIFAEFKVLKDEREKDSLEKKWEALDNQYEGKLNEDTRRQFNLNKNVTKIKVDKLVSLAMQAFFKSDPIFAVTPRPEFYKKEYGLETTAHQQDFLDYKLDNLPFKDPVELSFHSAAVKGTGILEMNYDIQREKKRREERYDYRLVPVIDPVTKGPQIDPKTQLPILENKGLKEFLTNWPNAYKDYPGYVKRLLDGKDINFIANYKETVYNDPIAKNVSLKDFYCRLNTEGYAGLKTTKLIVKRENYTWWELGIEEKKNNFYDIDKLITDEKSDTKKLKNFETLDFNILKCTYYFKLEEADDEEVKIVCWLSEEKKIVIGSILYPWYAIPCCYVPFYYKKKKAGFLQPGIAEDLTDNNLAENAILSLTLESAFISNTITPITKNADVQAQFLEKRFAYGVPIEGDPKDIDFLQKYMKPPDINGLLMLLQYLVQGDDDITRISSLMSGKETSFDPQAPASKTIALLKMSGIDMDDYISHMTPSFNEIGYILLNMYYQMSKEDEGRKYQIHPERVVGDNPFGVLQRNEMIARTNIQAQAYAFAFDKVNEKGEDLALYQVIRQEPLVAKNPEAVYTLLKNIIENWSAKWKNISSKVLPTLSDFKKMQLQTAMQGVALYVQSVLENAKNTGVAPEFDVNALLPVVADLQAQLVTPPDPEIQKEQEKKQKEAAGA